MGKPARTDYYYDHENPVEEPNGNGYGNSTGSSTGAREPTSEEPGIAETLTQSLMEAARSSAREIISPLVPEDRQVFLEASQSALVMVEPSEGRELARALIFEISPAAAEDSRVLDAQLWAVLDTGQPAPLSEPVDLFGVFSDTESEPLMSEQAHELLRLYRASLSFPDSAEEAFGAAAEAIIGEASGEADSLASDSASAAAPVSEGAEAAEALAPIEAEAPPEPEIQETGQAVSWQPGMRQRNEAPPESLPEPPEPEAPSADLVRASLLTSQNARAISPEVREAMIEIERRAEPSGRLWRFLGRTFSIFGSKAAQVRKEDVREAYRMVPHLARHSTFPKAACDAYWNSRMPLVILFVNNKGGVGKTTCAVNTASTFAMMGRPKGTNRELKTLIIDQNYGNSDLADRMNLSPGKRRGIEDYLASHKLQEYLSNAGDSGGADSEADGGAGELPSIAPYITSTDIPNLDLLLISGTDRARSVLDDVIVGAGTKTFDGAFEHVEAHLATVLSAATEDYDVIVVDMPNCKPRGKDLNNRLLWLWASAADVMYLVLDSVNTSFTNAKIFVDEVRELFGEDERGLPVVPIFNLYPEERPEDGRWLPRDAEEAYRLEHEVLPQVGADSAVGLDGHKREALKVPDYPEVMQFNNEGRSIALSSQRFAGAFSEVSIDAFVRGYAARVQRNKSNAEGNASNE